MMTAAGEALLDCAHRPLLIGVTVLTSMARQDLEELNWGADPVERVCELAMLAESSGLDGVVCSAAEAKVLSQRQRAGFLMVTPGIRQVGDASDDQRRVVTPTDAIAAGATHLVVGRSVTASDDPARSVADILALLH